MRPFSDTLDRALHLHREGRLQEAEALYHSVVRLDANHTDALHLLGVAKHQQGNDEDAVEFIRRAVKVNPTSAAIHSNLGAAHRALGDMDEAIACYREAVRLAPKLPEARYNLGNALWDNGDLEDAEQEYRRAIEEHPDFADAHYNLGTLLSDNDKLDEAITCFLHTVELKPKHADAWNNLGLAQKRSGQFQEAVSSYRRAIGLNTDYTEAWNNLGSVFQELGKLDDAHAAFSRALSIQPKFHEARFNRALLCLLRGEFQQGWTDYKYRSQRAQQLERQYKELDSSSFTGKSVLVRSEQGLGDEIMFATCLPDLISRAGHCVVECDPRLTSLYRRSFPTCEIISRSEDASVAAHEHVDVELLVGSLPKFFRQSIADFPRRRRLLVPNPESKQEATKRLQQLGNGLKVGISWRGGALPDAQRKRSTSLNQWKPLLELSGITFVNLQHGDCADELKAAEESAGITIHQCDNDQSNDFEATAATIASLDLVISVGNTTAHLAGSLGTPVWVLLPHVPDWNWFLEADDCPWYSSARLFRQTQAGNWTNVFTYLTQALRERRNQNTARPHDEK